MQKVEVTCRDYYHAHYYAVDTDFEPISPSSEIEGIYAINGSQHSILNIFTNILADAGRLVSTHGTFKCELCNSDGLNCPIHRNITMFVVGGPPVIESSEDIDGM